MDYAITILRIRLSELNARIVKCYPRATGAGKPMCACLTIQGCKRGRSQAVERRDEIVAAIRALRDLDASMDCCPCGDAHDRRVSPCAGMEG